MSTSGSVLLTGLAFLENARIPDPSKPKTVVFDAVLNLEDKTGIGANDPGFSVSYLTYYNAGNLSFSDESTPYFIVAKIAKVEHDPSPTNMNQAITLSAPGSDLTNCDYAFVGDIDVLIPAPSEVLQSINGLPNVYITASGVVDKASDYSAEVSYFTITPPQYVSTYHKKFGPSFKSTLPIRCIIKQSHRWTSTTKPRPRPGKVVSIAGTIGEIVRTSVGSLEYVEIIADQVAYLAEVPVAASKLNNTLDPVTPDGKKRKLKFSGVGCSPSPLTHKKQRPTMLTAESSSGSVGSSSGIEDYEVTPTPTPLTLTLPPVKTSGPAAAAGNRNKGPKPVAQAI